MNILYAEDHENLRVSTTMLLESLGHNVLAVDMGESLLEKLNDGRVVDVVITDVDMPGMSGLELLRRIRADIRHADLRVIVYSGNDSGALLAEVQHHGGIFVDKLTGAPGLLAVLEP